MIEALAGKIILEPNERTNTTDWGLEIVGGNYNPEGGLRRGKVVSVGAGCREVKVGDEACYMAYSGLPITFEGKKYLTMVEGEVIGITQDV